MTVYESSESTPEVSPAPAQLFRRLLRRPLALISLAFLSVVVLIAVIGPWIAPYDPNHASLSLILAPPNPEHPLGNDSSGRDVLSRLLAATQVSVFAALLAVVTALFIGVTAGLIAGYFHGWFDSMSSWVTSLLMALPGIVVLMAVQAVVGPSVWIAMFVFGILISPAYFRLVYASVNAVRQELYIDAARVAGLGDTSIIGRHVLSVVRAPIIIQSAIVAGITIAIQAGLEFLGLGDASVPTWGQMLNDAFTNIYQAPLLMLWPSLAIALTCMALTILANTMRDVLERTVSVRRRRPVTRSTSEAPATQEPAGENSLIIHDDEATRGSSETLLRVRDLKVSYQQAEGKDTEVVHGVSLDIRKGEIHGLVGESGSGKTQTAFALLGLLSRGGHVTGGTIDYQGTELAGGTERTYAGIRGKRIGYIPQEPMSNLDPAFTIGSQLVEPLRTQLGLSKKDATDRSLRLLERVGIPNPKRTFDAYPFEVSGGMAQRVLIAGAVSTEPDLIIADEPTTALDVTVQAEVLDLLRDLQQEQNLSMLLVTHNFGVVADLCDRVTVMQHGLFIEQGPVRKILGSPTHPYTKSLLEAILDGGPARQAYSSEGGRS